MIESVEIRRTLTRDENYYVRGERVADDLWVTWKAWRIVTSAEDGLAPLFSVSGQNEISDSSPSYEECKPCAYGQIKWDGCADFDLTPEGSESFRHHTCSTGEIDSIVAPIRLAYMAAAMLMPEHAQNWERGDA